jgi:hypothetical protein
MADINLITNKINFYCWVIRNFFVLLYHPIDNIVILFFLEQLTKSYKTVKKLETIQMPVSIKLILF